MPIYEYVCKTCKRSFEHLVRSKAEERQLGCPKCGSNKVTKQLSVFAARSEQAPASAPVGGGCGCGDPNGPCNVG